MASNTNLATNGTEWELPHHPQDIFIDMQYAKHDCKCPEDFVAQPWMHYRDALQTYLSLRFEHGEVFKSHLDKVKLKRVENEEERISQTRANISSYKEKTKLMTDLKKARIQWKAQVRAKIADYPASWRRSHAKNLEHLGRVQSWNVEDESNYSGPPPKLEPEYGFKACAIYFKKSSAGFDGHTHRHDQFLAGTFPNQKIPVHKILQEEEKNPLSETCPPDHLRYFHFRTNNIHWIKRAIARYYNEPDGDYNDLNVRPSDEKSRAEKLLSREFWRGQVHGLGGGARGKGPIHGRHMRSRCSIIPDG